MCTKRLTLDGEMKGGAVVLSTLAVKKDSKETKHQEHYKMLNHVLLMTAILRACREQSQRCHKEFTELGPQTWLLKEMGIWINSHGSPQNDQG